MRRVFCVALVLATVSDVATSQKLNAALTVNANMPGQRSVVLTWAETTPKVTNFKIYRGTTAGGENYAAPLAIVPGTQFTYTDTTVASGNTYYYTATAVLGVESAPSNEASAVIATLPASPSTRRLKWPAITLVAVSVLVVVAALVALGKIIQKGPHRQGSTLGPPR